MPSTEYSAPRTLSGPALPRYLDLQHSITHLRLEPVCLRIERKRNDAAELAVPRLHVAQPMLVRNNEKLWTSIPAKPRSGLSASRIYEVFLASSLALIGPQHVWIERLG